MNPEQPRSAGRFRTSPAIAVIAYQERGQQELTSNESDLLLTENRRDSYSTVDCNQSAAPAWFQVDWYRPRDKRCNATAGLTDITRQRQSGVYTTPLWANNSGCFGIDDAVLIQGGTNRPTGSITGRSSNLRRYPKYALQCRQRPRPQPTIRQERQTPAPPRPRHHRPRRLT